MLCKYKTFIKLFPYILQQARLEDTDLDAIKREKDLANELADTKLDLATAKRGNPYMI